jgi:4-hydroxy-4-methyl-2-oxoglutarate aldolase
LRETEVFARALEKAQGERTVKQALDAGVSAKEAFATYGIL